MGLVDKWVEQMSEKIVSEYFWTVPSDYHEFSIFRYSSVKLQFIASSKTGTDDFERNPTGLITYLSKELIHGG